MQSNSNYCFFYKYQHEISNDEKIEVITLLEVQVIKSNHYKKMIDILQNFFFTKKNQC